MDTISLEDKSYKFVTDYKHDDTLRTSFNSLVSQVFHFSFEKWYQDGYWKDAYIPYSLEHNGEIVSNVSVNLMEFLINNHRKTFIQIGTVMTNQEYRNKGLSKVLIDRVLEDWKDRCDLIYLFANDSVLDFYPKFGFRPIEEYEYFKRVNASKEAFEVRKLDMSFKVNQDLLYKKASESMSFSKVAMLDNPNLIMFYATYFMKEDVYYIKALDAIAIAKYSENLLYVMDVFCEDNISLEEVIDALATDKTNQVVLGFLPNDTSSFDEQVFKNDDTLFILADKHKIFEEMKFKFPILSHA